MKELPATFAMRPFNFDTLAVEAYNLAKDERIAEAAVPALLMVAIALLPLILLSRQIANASQRHVANGSGFGFGCLADSPRDTSDLFYGSGQARRSDLKSTYECDGQPML